MLLHPVILSIYCDTSAAPAVRNLMGIDDGVVARVVASERNCPLSSRSVAVYGSSAIINAVKPVLAGREQIRAGAATR